jgi:hypothetical protein
LADGCDTGAVIHEIGHAAGIFHEQSREDRDEHVIVHWGNIETGKGHNFKKYSESDFLFWGDRDGRDVGPYDFSSIMHYGSDFFSSNGQPTLTRRYGCTGLECLITPNRSALSALDRMYIHEIYCPMLNWDSNRCRNYYSSGGSFAYRISARTGGAGGEERCLDIAGGSRENQAKVNGFACHTGENQLYYVELRTDGAFTIRNRHSGLCLDVPGGSTGYVEMQQYACHGGANQKFRLYGGGGSLAADDKHGQMQIRTQVGDKCLGFDWQNKLVTTDCTSARARSFKFIARDVPNQYFRISNEQSQECLDIPWGTSDVTWLQTHGCHASDNQKWRFLPRADDSFVIESKKSAKCLSASGMRIEQNLCGTPDQSIAPKNFYAHLLPTGGFELRTKTFPRLCVTYDGVGRISVAGCGGHRTQRWAVQR